MIREYYRYMDEVIAELVETVGSETRILVISDHGFGPAVGKHRMRDKYWYLSGSHRRGGVFLITGPGIAAGRWLGDFRALEVAPTLLALLGLPVARNMPGQVRADVLQDRGKSLQLRFVARHEQPKTSVRGPLSSAADEEIKEQLRALGYIE